MSEFLVILKSDNSPETQAVRRKLAESGGETAAQPTPINSRALHRVNRVKGSVAVRISPP